MDSYTFSVNVADDDGIQRVCLEVINEDAIIKSYDLSEGKDGGYSVKILASELSEGLQYRIVAYDMMGAVKETKSCTWDRISGRPVISNIDVDRSSSPPFHSLDSYTFSVNVADDDGISRVYLEVINGDDITSCDLSEGGDGGYSVKILAANLSESSLYRIVAYDMLGAKYRTPVYSWDGAIIFPERRTEINKNPIPIPIGDYTSYENPYK